MTIRGTGKARLFEAYVTGVVQAGKWTLELILPAIVSAYILGKIFEPEISQEE